MDASLIKSKLEELANINGFTLSENADKIINAKLRFFGEEWQKCPCDRDNNERFCCSQLCKADVRTTGTCHCNLFKKKEG